MEKHNCRDCTYFLQHYALGERGLVRIWCGHCTHTHPRSRKPDAPACTRFSAGADREKAFATKEYLTRKLLQKVLDMDLLTVE